MLGAILTRPADKSEREAQTQKGLSAGLDNTSHWVIYFLLAGDSSLINYTSVLADRALLVRTRRTSFKSLSGSFQSFKQMDKLLHVSSYSLLIKKDHHSTQKSPVNLGQHCPSPSWHKVPLCEYCVGRNIPDESRGVIEFIQKALCWQSQCSSGSWNECFVLLLLCRPVLQSEWSWQDFKGPNRGRERIHISYPSFAWYRGWFPWICRNDVVPFDSGNRRWH